MTDFSLKTMLLFLLAMTSMVTACNDDDDEIDYTEYYGWRDKNNHYADACLSDLHQLGNRAYFTDTIHSGKEPWVYRPTMYRVLQSANEDSLRAINRWITPLYSSTLKVHYTLYDTKSVFELFDDKGILENQTARNDASVMNQIFFDSSCKADTLESMQVQFFENFTPGTVITGWGDALQNMHIGDNWLVMIPWYLGYGQAGSGSKIDPYSNLFFRIELVDITNWGAPLPNNDK